MHDGSIKLINSYSVLDGWNPAGIIILTIAFILLLHAVHIPMILELLESNNIYIMHMSRPIDLKGLSIG